MFDVYQGTLILVLHPSPAYAHPPGHCMWLSPAVRFIAHLYLPLIGVDSTVRLCVHVLCATASGRNVRREFKVGPERSSWYGVQFVLWSLLSQFPPSARS